MAVMIKGVKGKKIAVAMSGGVDSSVCAWMLKESGADVFGITMKTVPGSKCCSLKDIQEAQLVSKDLGIEHHVVDLRGIFEKEVIDYFVDESLKGKNPNPCVPCNRKVKFGALIEAAEKLGAELIATGHYARLEKKDGKIVLKRPLDLKKDQSYVLSMLPKQLFYKLLFPIGDYSKEEIREIAKENKIRVYEKPENQDLCFLHKEKGDFIVEYTKKQMKSGNIVDKDGTVIGKHEGIAHYTIGQRKGIGIKAHKKYYVMAVDSKKNEITVGDKQDLFRESFYVHDLNWVSIDKPEKPIKAKVLVRNKAEPKNAQIVPEGKNAKVIPDEPIWAISPGQIAVFIENDVVLGGGWIK